MLEKQIQFTLRRLLKSPLISIINLSGLALGIACAYLGISYVRQEYSYEREFADAERIYRVGVDFMNMGGFAVGPEYLPEYLQTHSEVVETSTRLSVRGNINLKEGDRDVHAFLTGVDSSFFRIFNFPVIDGRRADLLRNPDQTVISKDFAMRWFGHTGVVGRQLELPIGEQNKSYSISAVVDNTVMQTHLRGDIWIPIQPFLTGEKSWYSAAYYTYFKLRSERDFPTFLGELESIRKGEIYENYIRSRGLAYEEWIQQPDAYRFIVHPLTDIHLKSALNFEMSAGGNLAKIRGFLLIGVLVLLIAIANYINLTTARSYTRVKEIGVKKSLGVLKKDLIRQFVGESLVESVLVLILSAVFMKFILNLFEIWTGDVLLMKEVMDFNQVFLFILFTLGVGVLASLYPAFYLSSIKPGALIRDIAFHSHRVHFRRVLVTIQFAITTGLIFSSLTIFKQLHYMGEKDLGFKKDGLMVIHNLPEIGTSARAFREQLISNPIVVNSSFANSLPGSTNLYQSSFKTPEMENSIPLRVLPVDGDFIETMGIRLLEGSNFLPGQERDSTVAIINEAAKKALGLQNAIGAEIGEGVRVIGVVSDFHIESLKQGIKPVVLEHEPIGNTLTLRLESPPGGVALSQFIDQAEALWKNLSSGSTLQYSFIDETFLRFADQERIESKGILALTAMALLIACLGLFGLTTFSVKRREKEIGIRKILGSSVFGIVRLLSGEYLILILIAFMLALPVSWYLMQNWLQNYSYRIELVWWLFGIASIIALIIAFLTVGIQGLRAATVNPANILRNE